VGIILWIKLITGVLLSATAFAQALPPGTAVPIQLSNGLNANKDKVGQKISGRVMQEVPLGHGDKISERSRITGHIVRVSKQPPSGSTIVVKFDSIDDGGRTIPLTVSALAVASSGSVDQAQAPINATSDIDPTTQWVTRQVGGDIVNRGRRKAGSASGVRGTWLQGSSVLIKLTPNPGKGCPDGPGYDHEQAVWIFSSAACGTYNLSDLKIANSGATQPFGEIVLTSPKNIDIRDGSGWLLMTVSPE
jgi:hypothetical protein